MKLIRLLPIAVTILCLAGCARSGSSGYGPASGDDAWSDPVPSATTPAAHGGPSQPPAAPPVHKPRPDWPAFSGEPVLGVLLDRGPALSFRLQRGAHLPDRTALPAGTVVVRASGDGFSIAGRRFPGPRLSLGDPGITLGNDHFAGAIVLVRDRGDLLLIEQVGIETWLEGVLPAEMNPRWPVEALAAQAIVARSYAAARWQDRSDQPWQLVRGTADVAYDGAVAPSAQVAAAISDTRGQILVHDGQAILARFHACSGGRTEDSAALWPDATLADGRTPIAPYMTSVDDPASAIGARGLHWTATHQDWRAAIPVADLTSALRAWSAAVPSRPRIGTVHAVRSAGRRPSGRVEQVEVTSHGPGGEHRDLIDAQEFRLAVGANRLRSLLWDRCVMASAGGGQLVVEGHGFGHGVGLPQVSAWALAQQGMRGPDIVRRYYGRATLVRMWR